MEGNGGKPLISSEIVSHFSLKRNESILRRIVGARNLSPVCEAHLQPGPAPGPSSPAQRVAQADHQPRDRFRVIHSMFEAVGGGLALC